MWFFLHRSGRWKSGYCYVLPLHSHRSVPEIRQRLQKHSLFSIQYLQGSTDHHSDQCSSSSDSYPDYHGDGISNRHLCGCDRTVKVHNWLPAICSNNFSCSFGVSLMGTSLSYKLYQQCTSCIFSQILLAARVKKADNDISSTSLSALENRLTYYKKVVNSILFFLFFLFFQPRRFLPACLLQIFTIGTYWRGTLQRFSAISYACS